MKKIYLFIILAVVITVIIFAYINTQYVSGTSEDGKWKAMYYREFTDPKKTWSGTLYWKGKENIEVISIEFKENEKVITYIKPGLPEKNNKNAYGFVVFGGKPDKNDKLEVVVRWREKGKEYKDNIIMGY